MKLKILLISFLSILFLLNLGFAQTEFVDPCADLTKSWEITGNPGPGVDGGNPPQYFHDSDGQIGRFTLGTYAIYNLNEITDFNVRVAMHGNSAGTAVAAAVVDSILSKMMISVGPDADNFTEVVLDTADFTPSPGDAGNWNATGLVPVDAIPAGTNFIKIQANTSGAAWSNQLVNVNVFYSGSDDVEAVRPKKLNAQAIAGGIGLSWVASYNADSYSVLRSETEGGEYTEIASGLTETSYDDLDESLVVGTTYYYIARATNTTGESENSNEAAGERAAVEFVDPCADLTRSWEITGNPGPGIDGGDPPQYFHDSDGQIGRFTNGTYAIYNLNEITDFNVRVAMHGNSAGTAVAAAVVDSILSKMMISVGPDTDNFTEVVLDTADFTPSPGDAGNWNATGLVPVDAIPAGTNFIKIQANTSGAAWSNQLVNVNVFYSGSDDVEAVRPKKLNAQPIAAGIGLSWVASYNAESYSVWRSETEGGEYTEIASGLTETSYDDLDEALVVGTTYYYIATATNAAGVSENSNEAAVERAAVEFVDPCADLTRSWEITGNPGPGIDGGDPPAYFHDSDGQIGRFTLGTYAIYNLSEITDFNVRVAMHGNSAGTAVAAAVRDSIISKMMISVGPDTANFTEVVLDTADFTPSPGDAGNWNATGLVPVDAIPAGTNFIKIQANTTGAAWSNQLVNVNIFYTGGEVLPVKVKKLAATSVPGGIDLSWVGSYNATSLKVMRSDGGEYAEIADVTGESSYSDMDGALVVGQTYSYKIVATNGVGDVESVEASAERAGFEFIDPCADLTRSWEITGNPGPGIDGGDPPQYFHDSDGQIGRFTLGTYAIYNLSEITDFNVRVAMHGNSAGTAVAAAVIDSILSKMMISVGPDTANFTEVVLDTADYTPSPGDAGNWNAVGLVPADAIPAGTNFIKIQANTTGAAWSNQLVNVNIFYTGGEVLPVKVKKLAATSVPGGIDVSWVGSYNATSLSLMRSDGGDYAELANVTGESSYSDVDGEVGTTYSYQIKAVNGIGESVSGESSAERKAFEFIDSCVDLTKLHNDPGAPANGQLLDPPTRFQDDDGQIIRMTGKSAIYNLSDIIGFDIRACLHKASFKNNTDSPADSIISKVAIYAGSSLESLTEVALDTSYFLPDTTAAYEWFVAGLIPAEDLPAGSNFLKIMFNNAGADAWNAQLQQAEVEYTGGEVLPVIAKRVAVGQDTSTINAMLTWVGSHNADSYRIEKSSNGGDYEALAADITETSYRDTATVDGSTYSYMVYAVNEVGESAASNEATIGIIDAIDDDIADVIPKTFELAQNYPNPFNPITTIKYQLPSHAEVKIYIYNILGKKVRTLINLKQAPGRYEQQWDARNDHGARVSSGVYFYQVVAKGANLDVKQVKKMMLLK